MSKTIIVGGGICGLMIGALLSKNGDEVHVLERKAKPGGRALIWEKDGFVVDYGIHVIRFGPFSAISKICRELSHTLEFSSMGTSYLVDFDGNIKEFPTSPKGFITTELFGFKETFIALLKAAKVKFGSNYEKLLKVSVFDWLNNENITGGLRRYFELVSASMLVCPFVEKSSAGELLINLQKVLKTGYSALYPSQGWKPLFDLFIKTISESGKIKLKTKVTEVIIKDNKAVGVVANGKKIMADRVIVTLPLSEIMTVIQKKHVTKSFIEKCSNILPTSGISLDYGLDHRVSNSTGWWYFYDLKAFGLFTSNVCNKVAPEGKQLFTIFKPTSLDEIKTKPAQKEIINKIEQAVFNRFSGFEQSVEWSRKLAISMVDGVEINISQTILDRPGPIIQDIDNLFLCGDSIAAEGAGGDVGHETVLECYKLLTGKKL